MRNLAVYPITLLEAQEAVERALREHEAHLRSLPPGQVPIGDIHGAALQEAAKRLHRLGFAAWDGKATPRRRSKGARNDE